ncbi:hypothetical protein HYS48_02800, partial [Candidatus Woesearchaeota archaeon]|nr:hypothetical protein [Candidatus Woesearchaeota archaeon]
MMKPFAIAGLTALLFASTSGIAAAEQSATVPKTEALEARVGGTVSSSQQSKQYPVTEMRAGMRGLYGKFFSGTLTLGENSVSYAGKEPKFNFNIPYSQISTDVKVLV